MSEARRLRRFTLAVQFMALPVLFGDLLSALLSHPEPTLWWQLVLVAALFAATWLVPVTLHFGNGGFLWNWVEGAMVGGLVLLPGHWVPLVGAGATFVALAIRRQAVVKALFNMATVAVSSTAAAATFAALGGMPNEITLSTYGLLTLAAIVYILVSNMLTITVVSLATGNSWRATAADGVGLELLLVAANILLALAVVAIGQWQWQVLFALPLLVVAVHRAYVNTVRLSEQERAWQQLDETVRGLNELDESTVVQRLEAGATALFRADSAEVAFADITGPRMHEQPRDDGSHTVRAPLDGPGGPLGALRLDFAAPISLTRAEKRALTTLASAGGAALHNARQHAEASYGANHDALTGLPNRRRLIAAAADLHERRTEEGDAAGFALLLVDLDRFKEINDTLGHSAGDLVLREVADRLCRVVRSDATVCRLGGDEFAILMPGLRDVRVAEQIAVRIVAALTAPAEVDGVTVSIGGSIGIACSPADAENPQDLLRCADVSMYAAKRAGGGVARRYDPDHDPASIERLALEPALRAALLADDQLVVHIQPQVDMLTGAAVGAEALVRWQHPLLGLLAPYVWLPLVNQCGLQGELTQYVLRHSLRIRAEWAQCGADLPVAVNLAPRDLLDSRLPALVRGLLTEYATMPDRLILEIPETIVSGELETVTGILGELHGLGVQLSLDDFGAGGAPIAVLTRVPIDELKIDRSFVADLVPDGFAGSGDAVLDAFPRTGAETEAPRERAAEAVVAAAVSLGNALGLRIVAEGVETPGQATRLRQLGCTLAQGFLYERPQPAASALTALLQRAASARTADVVRLHARRAR